MWLCHMWLVGTSTCWLAVSACCSVRKHFDFTGSAVSHVGWLAVAACGWLFQHEKPFYHFFSGKAPMPASTNQGTHLTNSGGRGCCSQLVHRLLLKLLDPRWVEHTAGGLDQNPINVFAVAPAVAFFLGALFVCLLYTSPSPRDRQKSRMPSSA